MIDRPPKPWEEALVSIAVILAVIAPFAAIAVDLYLRP